MTYTHQERVLTTIAAYASGTTVWMAADGISVDENYRRWPEPHKIARLPVLIAPDDPPPPRHAEALIGFGGSVALIALIQHELTLPHAPEHPDPHNLYRWAHHVACAITALALELKPPITDNDGHLDGQGLLGFAGRLWSLTTNAATPLPHAWAIGTGGEYALGAIHAQTYNGRREDPEDILRAALRAAIAHDSATGEPLAWHHVTSPYPDEQRDTADDPTLPLPDRPIHDPHADTPTRPFTPDPDRIIHIPDRQTTA